MDNFKKNIQNIISNSEQENFRKNEFNLHLKESTVDNLLNFVNQPNVMRTFKTMSTVHRKYMPGRVLKFLAGANKDYFIVLKIVPIDNSEKYFEINKIVMSIFYCQNIVITEKLFNEFLQGPNKMQGDIPILTFYRNVQWDASASFSSSVSEMTNTQIGKINEYINVIDIEKAKESFLYQIKHYLTSKEE